MEVKGMALVVIPNFIKSQFSDTGFAQWLQLLPEDARSVYSRPILVNQWFDYGKYFLQPCQKLCDLFFAGNPRGGNAIGRFSADYALTGIYKLFIQWGSIEFILKKAGTILTTYYRPIKVEVPLIAKGRGLLQITEFPELHPIVEQRILGWVTRAGEISGAKKLNVSITSSLLKKQSFTEFTILWEI
jgi:hypothetical protein